MVGVSNFCPAMAVPITVKMPEPITAPMPSAVSDHGPSVFFSACAGSSESLMSLSIDLRASSWLGRADLLEGQLSDLASAVNAQLWSLRARAQQLQRSGLELKRTAKSCFYRFDWPRTIFFTFFFVEPRGVVRLALGAAFLRAARFIFFRSVLSSIFLVSATCNLFHCNLFRIPAQGRVRPLW